MGNRNSNKGKEGSSLKGPTLMSSDLWSDGKVGPIETFEIFSLTYLHSTCPKTRQKTIVFIAELTGILIHDGFGNSRAVLIQTHSKNKNIDHWRFRTADLGVPNPTERTE